MPVAFEHRGGQERTLASIWCWAAAVSGGVVISCPPDPTPQGSFLGALADTCDCSYPIGEKGVTRHDSRVGSPTSWMYNMRAVRNLARNVAQTKMIVKTGIEELMKVGYTQPRPPLVAYPAVEIRQGSYMNGVNNGEIKPPPHQLPKV